MPPKVMKSSLTALLCAVFMIMTSRICAQVGSPVDSVEVRNSWLTPATGFHRSRFWAVNGAAVGISGSTLLVLNHYWYADYPRGAFHFFNDNAEWLQVDKAGHMTNAYYLSLWSGSLYKWAGVRQQRYPVYGALAGTLFLTTIEILDGFSAQWGASAGDMVADISGSLLYALQERSWGEQRIRMKLSSWPPDYEPGLTDRTKALFGNTVAEQILKDYNGLTTWLSINIASFLSADSKYPKWLNIAAGYGADGLLGGFDNRWCGIFGGKLDECPSAEVIDRTDIPRSRQFYLSLDLDLHQIRTSSGFLNVVLDMANIIKIPAPAIEWNTAGGLRLHPIYF